MDTPESVAQAFAAAINAEDLTALRSLMADDHIFVDARGNKFADADKMLLGWQHFFHAYPDYRIAISHTLVRENLVALFGQARGKWRVNDLILAETWSVSAGWLAEIEAGKVKTWRVFCDTSWATPPQ